MRLRLTNAETKALDSMGHRWWRLAGMDEATARRRLYRLGEDRYRDRLMLAWARAGGDADAASWRELATLPERWSAPKFPLKAADFIARGIAEGPRSGRCWRWPRTPGSRRISRSMSRRSTPSPTRPSHASPATTGREHRFRLCRYFAGSTAAGCLRRVVCLRGRRARRLRHRRADAAGSGAADRRRTGGADHRDLGRIHQSQPRHRLSPLRRPPPRADRDLGGRIDDRARRLRLYAADQCRRGAGDRRHADLERAAAPSGQTPRHPGSATPGSALARWVTASWLAAPRARA